MNKIGKVTQRISDCKMHQQDQGPNKNNKLSAFVTNSKDVQVENIEQVNVMLTAGESTQVSKYDI